MTNPWIAPKEKKRLIAAAVQARSLAYAPYSGFAVGAALMASDGRIFTGCNVENASYGATRCAEQTAFVKAVSEGVRRIEAVAVVADGDEVCAPCGVCRQMLAEFGTQVWVIMANTRGESAVASLEALLPNAFTGERLQAKEEQS